MKKNSILAIAFVVFGLLFSTIKGANASTIRAEIKGAYFRPTDAAFKEIYGQGQTYGAEIGLKLGKFFSFWVAAENFSKKGKMSFTQEETNLKIIPINVGVSLEIPLGLFAPYGRLAVGYFHYEESNILGQVKKNNLGYLGQVGFFLKIFDPLYLDLFGQYSYCRVKPLELEADLGGLKVGLGLGLQF